MRREGVLEAGGGVRRGFLTPFLSQMTNSNLFRAESKKARAKGRKMSRQNCDETESQLKAIIIPQHVPLRQFILPSHYAFFIFMKKGCHRIAYSGIQHYWPHAVVSINTDALQWSRSAVIKHCQQQVQHVSSYAPALLMPGSVAGVLWDLLTFYIIYNLLVTRKLLVMTVNQYNNRHGMCVQVSLW